MTEKEKRDAGLLYDANYDKELMAELDRCTDLCHEYNKLKPDARLLKMTEEELKQKITQLGQEKQTLEEQVAKLNVPLTAEAKWGKSWYDAK